jgi:hypothetical protein
MSREGFAEVYGVDFSGAKLAGRTTWIACVTPGRGAAGSVLTGLARLEDLAGTAERTAALAHLVRLIRESESALWALDFPFGFPVEVMAPAVDWSGQFAFLAACGEDGYAAGVECLRQAEALGGARHIRRLTDAEERAPFDPYHYRIIYQTFHGMRDVLGPLRRDRTTAILPFHYRRLPTARRVLVEACPSSTLKRLALPHQNYKQPEGGELTERRRATRRVLVGGLGALVRTTPRQRRVMLSDPGGDALDAVVAAVGAVAAWRAADHLGIARHRRYRREGKLFV